MVVEHFVCLLRFVVRQVEDIKRENADMSNIKQLKHCRWKFKGLIQR